MRLYDFISAILAPKQSEAGQQDGIHGCLLDQRQLSTHRQNPRNNLPEKIAEERSLLLVDTSLLHYFKIHKMYKNN